MKICIVGGGHIGTSLACYIKHVHPDYYVGLLTRRPEQFCSRIICHDIEQGITYSESPDSIDSDAEVVASQAEIVYIALPHFAVEKAFADIAAYVSPTAFVGVLPGGGGCEFYFNRYFKGEQTLFGFQRVPFTAKLVEYGKEVNLKSWKPYSVVGTLQRCRINEVCQLIDSCGLKTKKATNYLEVALTPTNPLLHTSRTYEIFGGHSRDYIFPERTKFYVGWTDKASRTLFGMEEELRQLLDQITIETGLDTKAIRPLSEHYESPTVEALTEKINSIATFQSVFAPMKEVNGGYVADLSSRMFMEDFPWGLAVIRSYFDIFGISAPVMDEVLGWYANYMGIEWFVDGIFMGKDLHKTGIIQKYGCKNLIDLESIYNMR